MNAEDYIDNGIVLDYCMDLLKGAEKKAFEQILLTSPLLQKEVQLVQTGLERYAEANRMTPERSMKSRIWNAIENMVREQKMDIHHMPVLNKYSDPQAWLKAITPLLPEQLDQDFFSHVLTRNDKVWQMLVMTRIGIPDEVHYDVHESFIILEGTCECHIGDKVYRLGAGDYLDIPLHEHHDLVITSPYVIGVVQRLAA